MLQLITIRDLDDAGSWYTCSVPHGAIAYTVRRYEKEADRATVVWGNAREDDESNVAGLRRISTTVPFNKLAWSLTDPMFRRLRHAADGALPRDAKMDVLFTAYELARQDGDWVIVKPTLLPVMSVASAIMTTAQPGVSLTTEL